MLRDWGHLTLPQYLWWWRRGIAPWRARAYMQTHGRYLARWLAEEE